MPAFKLIYFDATGRAEPIRILFALANVHFEDVRVPFNKWSKLKPTISLGTLPVLEVDGVQIGQTNAILSFLSLEFGYAGPSSISAALADSIAHQMADFLSEIFLFHIGSHGTKKSEKENQYKSVFTIACDKHFPIFEKALRKSSTGWLIDTQDLTHADILVGTIFEMLTRLSPNPSSLFDGFPLIAAHQKKFTSIRRVQKHIANRPKTLF